MKRTDEGIVEGDPANVSIESRKNGYQSPLRMSDGTLVSVVAPRPTHVYKDDVMADLITLVARLNLECDRFKDMFVIPPVAEAVAVHLKERDPRLRDAARLANLSACYGKVQALLNCTSRFPRHLRRGASSASSVESMELSV
jgi:hypothetical protein